MRAFARVNSIDRDIVVAPRATRRHRHLRQGALRPARGASAASTSRSTRSPTPACASTRSALSFPLEPTRLAAFAEGLDEILVVEEKAGVVEQQLRDLLLQRARVRPRVVGKRDAAGRPLVSRARRAAAVAHDRDRRRLARGAHSARSTGAIWCATSRCPSCSRTRATRSSALPYFCAGCPHNTSTKVPEGSRAQAGIGCHFMASWMDRDTEGLIQMGGEGVDWVVARAVHQGAARLPEPRRRHLLPLRATSRSARRSPRKAQHHLQDPLQRRGRDDRRPAGRRHDLGRRRSRARSRPRARSRSSSSPTTSPSTTRSTPRSRPAPSSTTAPSSTRCSGACARSPGVTILIYEQTCAAEKRRRRKKGELVDPARRVFINEARVRGLRRLLGAVELRRRAAAGDRARPQAHDRPVELQQGLLVRERLLPELRRRRRRPA